MDKDSRRSRCRHCRCHYPNNLFLRDMVVEGTRCRNRVQRHLNHSQWPPDTGPHQLLLDMEHHR